ncbi:hypothetical protein [Halocynthiibacter styelae]|uniref:Uncharacterized protein n=1 Tax=Halocynthiibacter styelae TaxID=2761955 RepID=A0A8J7IEA6_9RHOB|nr:hypothetical protein [Paenihalocynthiibacter styelae]MBI1494534.1 hypothetical protein [Paenihalocynthiibacter styelae]
MKLKDTGLHFGIVSVFAHWAGAICILCFAVGVVWEIVNPSHQIQAFIQSIACLIACLHVFRLVWRLRKYHPDLSGGENPAQVLSANGVAFGVLSAGAVLLAMLWIREGGAIVGDSWWFTSLYWLGFVFFLPRLLLHLFEVSGHVFKFRDESRNRMFDIAIEL